MFRALLASSLITAALGLATIGLTSVAHAADAKTIRIEPRPFYGATVTIEAGVRVFRPLPPEYRTIINPNKTPVNVSISEETRTVNKTVRHQGGRGVPSANGGYVGNGGVIGGGFGRGRGKGRGLRQARPGRFPGGGGRH